jgi:hypothetical protein
MTKPRRIRWVGHVARIGTRRMHIGFWWESQKERYHQEDLNVDGRIVLKLLLGRMEWY